VSRFGSDFWRSFDEAPIEQDLALAQTLRTVRAIRGVDAPQAPVQDVPHASVREEMQAALTHLCAAMSRLVEWMEQERRTDPEALQLMSRLRETGDGLVRCLSACPIAMISQAEPTDLE
jgi:hypothetical protein